MNNIDGAKSVESIKAINEHIEINESCNFIFFFG